MTYIDESLLIDKSQLPISIFSTISIFPLSVDVFVDKIAFVNLSNPFDIFDAMSQVASLPDSLSFYKSIHKTMNNVYKQGSQTTQVTIPTNHLLSL